MIGKLIIEILILWIIYALYMAILVHKRGPLGGIFFYPKVMQERVIEIGLMTDRGIKKTKNLCLYHIILIFCAEVLPLLNCPFHLLTHSGKVSHELGSSRRKRRTLAIPVKNSKTDFLFEKPDLVGKCRLAYKHIFRCPTEVQCMGKRWIRHN